MDLSALGPVLPAFAVLTRMPRRRMRTTRNKPAQPNLCLVPRTTLATANNRQSLISTTIGSRSVPTFTHEIIPSPRHSPPGHLVPVLATVYLYHTYLWCVSTVVTLTLAADSPLVRTPSETFNIHPVSGTRKARNSPSHTSERKSKRRTYSKRASCPLKTRPKIAFTADTHWPSYKHYENDESVSS